MSITVPRAEIHAVANRYGNVVELDGDLTASQVRELAEEFRRHESAVNGTDGHSLRLHGVRWRSVADNLRAQADDLDALVDRIEREVAP